MKRSKFEASELQVLAVMRNVLLLMTYEPLCPPSFLNQLDAQIGLLGNIIDARGIGRIDYKIKVKNGVVNEWPDTNIERIRALK